MKEFSSFCVFDMRNQRIFVNCFNIIMYNERNEETDSTDNEGIQDKKGKKIVIADLTKIDDTICNYFVICQGNSPSQVTAIVESIRDFTRKGADTKPFAVDGLRNAEWVVADYFRHIGACLPA